mmetsp:Transcript_27994/g.26852  ORF Transcript_27994/g.26852 Transcript_27994/m.26852 type:complete len:95 (+) Transcript_27994:561-845(+)
MCRCCEWMLFGFQSGWFSSMLDKSVVVSEIMLHSDGQGDPPNTALSGINDNSSYTEQHCFEVFQCICALRYADFQPIFCIKIVIVGCCNNSVVI